MSLKDLAQAHKVTIGDAHRALTDCACLAKILARCDDLEALLLRELWIRAHSRLGKIPVVLTLLGLSSSLQCTTKPSNFPLWEEKVIFLAFWGVLLISRKGVPTEMLPPNPGVLIHDWRYSCLASAGTVLSVKAGLHWARSLLNRVVSLYLLQVRLAVRGSPLPENCSP